MSEFKVSKHFKTLPGWQFTGAQIQLTHWLKKHGHLELAGQVCAASSNTALSPHLEEVDKILPIEATREQIFPKVFTDPLTIRHELTAMIGESVRRYPKGSTEGELSTDDKISILSELHKQIEEVGKKKTRFSRELHKFMRSDSTVPDYEDRLDALVIETGGYLTGLKGEVLDETIVDVTKKDAERVVDGNIYGALSFLDLVVKQDINAAGSLKPFEQDAAQTFLLGAGKVWRTTPRFVDTLSRYWGRATSERMGEASDDLSENMGQAVSRITEPRLQLGIAARLPKSKMIIRLHLLEVEKFIYARGWLKGRVEYNEGQGAGEWVPRLRDNVSTILVQAMNTRNPGYVVKAAEALPKMVDAIAAKAEKLDEELSEVLLSNQGSIIHHALNSGKLEKYPQLVFKALPKMVDAIVAMADELDEELSEVLLSNQGSIIYHALNSGKLEKYPQLVFKALPKIVNAIAAKANDLDEELAEVLLSNQGSIISRAINSGKLEKYLQAVFQALPKIMDAIAAMAEELDEERAEVLLSNQGSIIYHALESGKLEKYPQLVFKALPKMVDAIAAKADEFDEELSEVLLSNQGSIIYHALHSGKLEPYVEAVCEALPQIVQDMDRTSISLALASGRLTQP